MRIYFLSCRPSALKIDGIYLGTIDRFERFVDMQPNARHFAEVIPDGQFLPLNFALDAAFLKKPPDFAEVYLFDGGAAIYFADFAEAGGGLKVLSQLRAAGGLFTLFRDGGGVNLAYDGQGAKLHPLPREFAGATLAEVQIGGQGAVTAAGEGCVAVFSEEGEKVFLNAVEGFSVGGQFEATIAFPTVAGCKAKCTYSYDGKEMTQTGAVTEETRPVADDLIHFAFFESVLTRADFGKYLDDELKWRAADIPRFLGDFVGVTVPRPSFFAAHPDARAAGLVYPVLHNLYRIKYFTIEMRGGLITNIAEAE